MPGEATRIAGRILAHLALEKNRALWIGFSS
jgi:hypothetical protein